MGTALNTWRSEGREAVCRNFAVFRSMVAEARALAAAGRADAAAIRATCAAYFAQHRHCGLFVSPELERVLLQIGSHHARPHYGRGGVGSVPAPGTPARVLHVSTNVAVYSGIPGLIRRWMQLDRGRQHSLALTKQAPDPVPEILRNAVHATGGTIHSLNAASGGLVARARRLRTIAAEADAIVLHVWEQDVVPSIAFAVAEELPPVIYVNHGDHCFWLGSATADVVANLRESGKQLSEQRRNIPCERSLLLPTVMDMPRRTLQREEAKRRLGVAADTVLLVSIARAPKYMTFGGVSFAEAHVPLLRRHQNAVLFVVGTGAREDWQAAVEETDGRIRLFDQTRDTAPFYQAADIYVDSFPVASNTSMLEAASYEVPVVTRVAFAGADVLGADMPGLSGHMAVAEDLGEYRAVLSALIADGSGRAALGQRTRASVAAHHTGDAWRAALNRVYERAAAVRRTRPAPALDEMCLDEVDVLLPSLHSRAFKAEWPLHFHLGAMPLRERVRHWQLLGARQGSRLPFSRLLPDWLHCQYAALRRRVAAM